MGTDLSKSTEEASKKIDSYGTTCRFKNKRKKEKKKKQKDSKKDKTSRDKTPKEKIKQYKEEKKQKEDDNVFDKVKNFNEKTINLFEELIDLFKKTASGENNSSGKSGSVDFLFQALYFAAARVKSKFNQLLIDEIVSTLGCSEDSSFENVAQSSGTSSGKIYIKVKNIDLFNILKFSPEDEVGKYNYEKEDTLNGTVPYSMNRQLYHRIQSTTSFSQEYGSNYLAGGQPLMDIKYTTTAFDPFGNPLPIDDYFEITLNSLPNNSTTVINFLNAYYSSISIFDLDSLIKNGLNRIFGSFDLGLGVTYEENEDIEKFFKILKRIMGICSDPRKKIDVSGVAKLSDEDLIGDGFFEISDQDLRNIEEKVNNKVNGVITFIDCGTIEFPVNNQGVISLLGEVITENKDVLKVEKFLNGIKQLSVDPKWKDKSTIPAFNLSLDIMGNLLGDLPLLVFQTLLSPKALLGLFVMYRALNVTGTQYIFNLFDDAKEFLKKFKKFAIPLCRKIIAIFVEEVFSYIKSNIKKLVECLLIDIINEAKDKRLKMISVIVYILIQVRQGFLDFRYCKSVIDEILKLLNLATSQLGVGLPSFVLQASQFLDGVSQTRALAKTIEALQEAGIPTDDNADGTPNLMNSMMDSLLKGIIDESAENGKTEIALPPTPQFPKGIKLFGKSY